MKRLKTFDTRQRAILAVFGLGILVFLALSPIAELLGEFVFAPSQLNNISVVQKVKEIDLSWDRPIERDIKGYFISVNGQRILDEKLNNKDVDNYGVYDLEQGKEYKLLIGSEDNSQNISNLAEITVITKEQNSTYLLNPRDEMALNSASIAMLAIFLSILTFIATNWVLFFKVSGKRLFTVSAYPSIALAPLLILSYSLVLTISNSVIKTAYALVVAITYIFVSYLLVLTANILNGSKVHGQLPLEQAAKASQFIVGLISTYLMLIYTFSSNLNLLVKIILVLVFVFYFTYSSLSSIKELNEYNIVLRTLSVVLTMFIAILAISVWPIESIYSILVVAIIYYIIFNVALEVRGKVGRSLWIEYGVLIGLITLLLVTNSVWGINGTII